jgi:hypothetical protein
MIMRRTVPAVKAVEAKDAVAEEKEVTEHAAVEA